MCVWGGGWLLSPAHPQLQALSSKGLHFLPPPSPHLCRLGFLLPGGPPLCDWGRERGLWLHVVGWGVGRKKKRSSVAPPSRPTLMLTKSLPPKPAKANVTPDHVSPPERCAILSFLPKPLANAPFCSGMCVLGYPEEEPIFQANSLSGAFFSPEQILGKSFFPTFLSRSPAPPLRNPPRALQAPPFSFPRPPLPTSTQSEGGYRENKARYWASGGLGARPRSGL